jgi:cysteine synthase B
MTETGTTGIGVGQGVVELIGHTPLVRIRRITRDLPAGVVVCAKAEYANPGGSVKDRPALNMIMAGIRNGLLTPGKTILDATSGNTGLGYAMVGAALGFPVKLCVPRNVSPERIICLQAYGAELVITDPGEGTDGAIREVRRLYAENPDAYFYPDQYSNEANWRAHYESTGVEVWEQTAGRVTHFVAGLGTSGTMMGTGRRLRAYNPDIRLVSVQPDSPFHGLEGMKHMPTSLVPPIYDPTVCDRNIEVGTEESQRMVRRLAREEGLLVGLSAGAAMVASLAVASELESGVVVTVFSDGAGKYLSENFWRE